MKFLSWKLLSFPIAFALLADFSVVCYNSTTERNDTSFVNSTTDVGESREAAFGMSSLSFSTLELRYRDTILRKWPFNSPIDKFTAFCFCVKCLLEVTFEQYTWRHCTTYQLLSTARIKILLITNARSTSPRGKTHKEQYSIPSNYYYAIARKLCFVFISFSRWISSSLIMSSRTEGSNHRVISLMVMNDTMMPYLLKK